MKEINYLRSWLVWIWFEGVYEIFMSIANLLQQLNGPSSARIKSAYHHAVKQQTTTPSQRFISLSESWHLITYLIRVNMRFMWFQYNMAICKTSLIVFISSQPNVNELSAPTWRWSSGPELRFCSINRVLKRCINYSVLIVILKYNKPC